MNARFRILLKLIIAARELGAEDSYLLNMIIEFYDETPIEEHT